jgi:hypothetical protein
MVEISNFKKGAIVMKLNAAVTNLNVLGILMFHCGRDKNTENISLKLVKEARYTFRLLIRSQEPRRSPA